MPTYPSAGVHSGREAIRRHAAEFEDAWADWGVDIEDIRAAEDRRRCTHSVPRRGQGERCAANRGASEPGNGCRVRTSSRSHPPRTAVRHARRSPRSRGPVGVGDVAGERGDSCEPAFEAGTRRGNLDLVPTFRPGPRSLPTPAERAGPKRRTHSVRDAYEQARARTVMRSLSEIKYDAARGTLTRATQRGRLDGDPDVVDGQRDQRRSDAYDVRERVARWARRVEGCEYRSERASKP